MGKKALSMSKWIGTKDSRIKKRGDIYWARFSKKGIRIETSLNTNNFKLAISLAEKIESAILNDQDYKSIIRGEEQNGSTPLIGEKWNDFIYDKTHGNIKKNISKLRDTTLIQYINFWERYFKTFWEYKTFNEITVDEWEKYIEHARKISSKKEKLKIFNHSKYFGSFCTWAEKSDLLDKKPNIFNPDKNMHDDDLEEEETVGKNYSDEELKTFKVKSEDNKPFHLYVLMAMYMGMRSSEITQLNKDRIDLVAKIIKLKRADTKTKLKRTIPIHDEVYSHLVEQYNSSESNYLFPNRVDQSRPMDKTGFKKPWNSLRLENNITGRFHDLRHSYATRIFANKNINPVLACMALGMKIEMAMKTYIHFGDEQLQDVSTNFIINIKGDKT